MSKTMKKYEIGMAVANASDGRIKLTIEDSVATLRGEFTRKDRKPIKYKTGGWRYHFEDGAEFWTLNVSRIIGQLDPSAKSANEPKVEPKVESSAEPKPEPKAKSSAEPKANKHRYDELLDDCIGRLYHEGIGVRFAKSGRVTIGIKTEHGLSTKTTRVFKADKDGYMSTDEYMKALNYVSELDTLIVATLRHLA